MSQIDKEGLQPRPASEEKGTSERARLGFADSGKSDGKGKSGRDSGEGLRRRNFGTAPREVKSREVKSKFLCTV